ncbi:hypothetical protein ACKQTC_03000 [Peptococcus simiae]|uniref:Uncharacterized protein n=1 Tax=Peptococcus simiae TaxID=1643805 RepID=A0ABW9GXG7_9FIRM
MKVLSGLTEEQLEQALALVEKLNYRQWSRLSSAIERLYTSKVPQVTLGDLENERELLQQLLM